MASVSIQVDAIDNASGILGSIFNTIMSGANAFDIAAVAAAAAADFIGDSTQAAYEYAEEIKGISDVTGQSAESTSRLVQAMDDAGVSSDVVKKALREMSKDGVEPNIEELAALSDEFLTLNSGAERGQFLIDHFGKAGEQMARAMMLGGDAILELNDGVSENLVLTQSAIDAAEAYRKNVDDLNDSWEGFKITIGNAVIPAINSAFDSQNRWNAAMQQAQAELNTTNPYMIRHAAMLEYEALKQNEASAARLNGLASMYESTAATQDLGEATEYTADQIKEMSRANNEQLSLVQRLQGIMTDYNATLAETTEKYGENSQEVQDLQAEHEQAMRQIAYDLYLAKLQAGGLTDAEYQMGLQAGVSAGLIDQATVDMALAFDQGAQAAVEASGEAAGAWISAAGEISGAAGGAQESIYGIVDAAGSLSDHLRDLEGNYEITVTTTWENIGSSVVTHFLGDGTGIDIVETAWGGSSGGKPKSVSGSSGAYSSPMTQATTLDLSPNTIRLLAAAIAQSLAPVMR